MGTFFHGWRRKAGVVTLVATTTLTLLWFRSAGTVDVVYLFTSGKTGPFLLSRFGEFTWQWTDAQEGVTFHWKSDDFEHRQPLWSSRFYFEAWSLTLPFWSVVIPLTLFSGYLILIPSRKRPPTESQPDA